MQTDRRRARINVKALVILIGVMGTIAVVAFGGHHIRKRVTARDALEEGRALLEKQQWSEACKHLRRYLLQYPDDSEILERYATAHMAVRPRTADNINAAIAAYRRLLRHRPGDDKISDQIAKLYLRVGNHEEAIYACEKRLEVDPRDVSATVLKARVLLSRSKPEQAAAILKPLVEQPRPEAVEAYAMLARTTLERSDSRTALDDALAWLDAGVEAAPNAPNAYVARAAFYLDDFGGRKPRDIDLARRDLDAAESLSVDEPSVLLRLARARVAMGELDRTSALLERLSAIDEMAMLNDDLIPEEFALARYRIAGSLYRQMGDPARMTELADEALAKLTERYRSAFLPIGVELYALGGRVEDARRYLEEYQSLVEESTRGSSAVNEGLAVLAARVAVVDHSPYDVINLLRPVVDWNPRNAVAWRLLADAYAKTGLDQLAMEALLQVSARQAGDLDTEVQLVREYFHRRDWSSALRSARACERMAPDDLDIGLLRIEAELRHEFQRPIRSDAIVRILDELAGLRTEHPDVAAIRVLQAVVAENDGRLAETEASLHSAMAECADPQTAATYLAKFLERHDRASDALEVWAQSVERAPEDPAPRIAVARLQEAAGLYEESVATLTRAAVEVTNPAERRAVRQTLARLRLVHFDRGEAIASLEELAAEDHLDVASRVLLLEIPEILDDPARAEPYISELEEIQGAGGLDWRLHRARLWLNGDEWRPHVDEIDADLELCIQRKPRWWTRAVLVRTTLQERLGDEKRAEEILRAALSVQPTATDVAGRLLALLQRQQRFAEAKTILDRLDRANLASPGLDAFRLGVAIGTGRYEEAIEELRTRIAADPKASAERIVLARLLYSQDHDVDGAFALLDEAEAVADDTIAAVSARAAILLAEKRFDEAETVLSSNIAEREDFASYLLRAEFYGGRGMHELAEQDFQHLTTFKDTRAVAYQLLGRFYFKTDRLQSAIEAWDEGLRVDPGRTVLKRVLMRALLAGERDGDADRGLRLLQELLEEVPDDTGLHGLHAALLIDEGTPEGAAAARAELERVIELDDSMLAAHLALIDMDYANGDIKGAVDAAERALKANPTAPVIMLALARLERGRGNLSLARDYARAAVKADPKSVDAYVFLIDAALDRGDRVTAEGLISAADHSIPDHWLIDFKRGQILDAAGEVSEAIRLLEGLLESDTVTDPARVSLSLAGLYCKQRNDEKFEFHIRSAEERGADDAAARVRMRCMLTGGRPDAIVALVSKRRADHPEDLDTVLLGATLLMSTGVERYQRDALGLFEQVLAADADNIGGHLGLARAAYVLGDSAAVVRGYRGALAVDPDNQRALNDLAWVLAETGVPEDLEEAFALADRGVALYPADPHLRDTRGFVRMKRGAERDLAAAGADFLQAIELTTDPDLPTTRARSLINLADVNIKQGETGQAREWLLQAEEIHKQYENLTESEQTRISDLLALCE